MHRSHWKSYLLAGGLALLTFGVLVPVLILGRGEREQPQRCPPGLEAGASRCCGLGQHEENGRCMGTPTACASGMRPTKAGCIAKLMRVTIPGGSFELSVADWEPKMTKRRRSVKIARFQVDSHEVTLSQWQRCASADVCAARQGEPGRPVREVSPEQAAAYCAWAGGSLPSVDEWLAAAMGTSARRFPWGPTGLVCRRASFGLDSGPCGGGATGPDLVGARPDGATPEGVHDLAGNLAEWARAPDGTHVALGGSFASRLAAELKPAARPVTDPKPEHTGFRCVYR